MRDQRIRVVVAATPRVQELIRGIERHPLPAILPTTHVLPVHRHTGKIIADLQPSAPVRGERSGASVTAVCPFILQTLQAAANRETPPGVHLAAAAHPDAVRKGEAQMTILTPSTVAPASADVASIETLRSALSPVRARLLEHAIYGAVDTIPRLRRFMSHHVFAVWDFMCLAKRLQRDFTSTDVLWLPPARPSLARFINSIVLGEESDTDPDGRAASHFDLYLAAMDEVRAPTAAARRFVEMLGSGAAASECLTAVGAPAAVQAFVAETLRTVANGTSVEVLASFLFGREDLIPDMFAHFLPRWADSQRASRFAYYVQRHIEMDGDDHGPAGQRALAELAADDHQAWSTARRAAEAAITARIALWDAVHADVIQP